MRRRTTTLAATMPRPLSTAARFVLALTLSIALLAPSNAFASRQGTDRVGSTAVEDLKISKKNAPDVNVRGGIVMTEDGQVLWSRGADTRRRMASTTKLMTALVVLDNAKLNEQVRISPRASRTPYGLGLHAGEKMSVRKLLELMLVSSSNDAAFALGEHVGGSMPNFVKMMNARATEMGLENTRFANPHGLDGENHYTTPRELAKLSQAAMKQPEVRRISLMRKVVMPGHGSRAQRARNATDKLLGTYPGIMGGKTGYTNGAMYCFVGTARRGSTTLTVVVLGAGNSARRFAETSKLMDWGFKHLKNRKIVTEGESVGRVWPLGNPGPKIPVVAGESVSKRVFTLDGDVSYRVSPAKLELPIFKGQRVGDVQVIQGGRVLAKVPAIATASTVSVEETVGAMPVGGYLDRQVPVRTTPVDAPEADVDPTKPVERKMSIDPVVEAPVAEGAKVGEVTYTQDGRVVATVPVVAAESVEEPGLMETMRVQFASGWKKFVGAEDAPVTATVVTPAP